MEIIVKALLEKNISRVKLVIVKGEILEIIPSRDSLTEKYADCIVLPGMINSHVHLGETFYKNLFSCPRNLSDYLNFSENACKNFNLEDLRNVIANYTLSKLLKSGSTTVVGARIKSHGSKMGIRNFSGIILMNSPKLFHFLENPERLYLEESSSQDELSETSLMIHSINTVDEEILKKASFILEKFNPVLMIHVAETKKAEKEIFSKWGMSSVEVLEKFGLLNSRTLLVHANFINGNDWNLIRKRKANIIHCPSSNLRLAGGILDIHKTLDMGINVCIGTDGFVTSGTFSLLEEARLAFLFHNRQRKYQEITPDKLFEMITNNPAKALNLNAGAIKKGAKADLIFIENDCLANDVRLFKEDLIFRPGSVRLKGVMIGGDMIIWDKIFMNKNHEERIDLYNSLQLEKKGV